MIDDAKEAAQLLHDMHAQRPIPVHLTPQLLEMLRSRGTQLRFDEDVLIESVLYLGDEGGIACGLKWPGAGKDAVITSLTHLRIDDEHPLAEQIKRYQSTRSRKIAMIDSGVEPPRGSVKPDRKGRRRSDRRRR